MHADRNAFTGVQADGVHRERPGSDNPERGARNVGAGRRRAQRQRGCELEFPASVDTGGLGGLQFQARTPSLAPCAKHDSAIVEAGGEKARP
jgi:hypothetical protein